MQILVLVLGVVLMAGLQLLVNRTRLGRQVRAVAADREAAEMLGINVNFVITATFFLGSALAGVAGIMGGLLFNQVTSTIGFIAGLKAFTAAVVGGIGSIPGAMLGGLLIGLAESFVTGYISSTYSNLIVFGILIVVMLVRPSGLANETNSMFTSVEGDWDEVKDLIKELRDTTWLALHDLRKIAVDDGRCHRLEFVA